MKKFFVFLIKINEIEFKIINKEKITTALKKVKDIHAIDVKHLILKSNIKKNKVREKN